MNILRNSVYDIHFPREDTVRVLSVDKDRVVVISLLKQNTLPYEIALTDFEDALQNGSAVQNTEILPAYTPQPTEKQEEAMEKSWSIIGEFVQNEPDCFDKKVRSRFIAEKSKKTGLQRKQIQNLLYRYWSRGMTKYALYPKYEQRGGAGKQRSGTSMGRPTLYPRNAERIPIGEVERGYIEEAIKKYYNRNTKCSLADAYREMIKMHYTDTNTNTVCSSYPTLGQFRYHAKEYINSKKRFGSRIYNKDKRGITGSSRSEALGPGDVYQIDATLADIYLVSHYDRTAIVGRPELYFVVDVFSRMIVGFYTCLESASWENARLALLNAFTDKVAFCRNYEIGISEDEWPCKGIPRELIVDNAELISKASNAIITGLGLTVKNEPAYRPDLKGIVESRFRLLNIKEKAKLPGAVLPDFSQRGSPDYRLDAKLTLTEFTKIIIHFVLNHNQRIMRDHPQFTPDIIRDNVPAIPIELWNWGVRHRTGSLREMPWESLNLALSQRETAQVTKSGIRFHGMLFECETAKRDNWFSKARISGGWKIDVAYNASEVDRIYWLADIRTVEVCCRTADSKAQFSGLSIEEVDWLSRSLAGQRNAYQDITLQADIDHDAEVEAIVKEAEQSSRTISFEGAKMKAKPKQIRENRKRENELMKAEAEAKRVKETAENETPENEDYSDDPYGYDAMFAEYAEEGDD